MKIKSQRKTRGALSSRSLPSARRTAILRHRSHRPPYARDLLQLLGSDLQQHPGVSVFKNLADARGNAGR
jgi:hypothetical protein